MDDNTPQASGVQELIDRLQQTGVEEGRTRGERAYDEARRQADELLAQARHDADEIVRQAQVDAERTRASGQEAVRLAVRDALLDLKEQVVEHFSRRIRRMVARTLRDPQFLQDLIRDIALRALPEGSPGRIEVLLPRDVAGQEEIRRNPQELEEGPLSRFAASLTGDMLREGLTLRTADDDVPGLRIRLVDQDVEIDLSDQAVTGLLLQHLLPRFRVMMEGVVK